jgi:hypothetical protein
MKRAAKTAMKMMRNEKMLSLLDPLLEDKLLKREIRF